MRASCIIVLDTSVLLLPCVVGSKSLTDIGDTFRSLASEGRLVVPGQVARGFAQNRPTKLGEVFKQVLDKKSKAVGLDVGSYPLLDGLPGYARVIEIEGKINDLIGQYQDALSRVINHIRGWTWNDPVSLLYGELFAHGVVLDPQFDEAAVREDLSRRQKHKIPPGYKDAGKEDGGIGDLLIWHTILQASKDLERDLLLITGEQKTDWWHRSNSESLYPRHQLVDEYRRASHGRSFHMVSLSEFLDLTAASADTIEEVRQEEAGAVTMLALQDRWPEIVEGVERLNRRFAALLPSARPISVSNQRIVLEAPYEFHRDRMNSDDVRSVLESVVSTLLGRNMSVETVLKGDQSHYKVV